MNARKVLSDYVNRQVRLSHEWRTIVDVDQIAEALAPQLPSFPLAEIKQLVFERVVSTGSAARWK
jgi:hypothetical protein